MGRYRGWPIRQQEVLAIDREWKLWKGSFNYSLLPLNPPQSTDRLMMSALFRSRLADEVWWRHGVEVLGII